MMTDWLPLISHPFVPAMRAALWSKGRMRCSRSSSSDRANASSSCRRRRLGTRSASPNWISNTVMAVVHTDSAGSPSSQATIFGVGSRLIPAHQRGNHIRVENDHSLSAAGRAGRPRSSSMSASRPTRAKRALNRLPRARGDAVWSFTATLRISRTSSSVLRPCFLARCCSLTFTVRRDCVPATAPCLSHASC